MAGNDKHPPLNPKRHSTNKRVSVGSANTTGARVAKALVTPLQKKRAAAMAVMAENAKRRDAMAAKVAAEIKAKRGVIGTEGANRLSYIRRKFPGGGMT